MKYELNESTNKYICPECEKEFSKNGIYSHYWRKHTIEGLNFDTTKNLKNGLRDVWNKGLTKETDNRLKERGEKLSNRYKSGELTPFGFCSKENIEYSKTYEYKKKQSLIMKQVVLDNPDSYSKNNVSGRVKNYTITLGNTNYTFKGTWEVLVATKLFEHNIQFTNEITPIEYFWKDDGRMHLYFPDFYLPEKNIYIEVKGFKRERDEDKWAVLNNLFIIDSQEINKIKLDEFDFSKFKGV